MLVVHIWPGQWGLPSIDPACLAAVMYLQLEMPGQFSIQESLDPQQSPTASLPFLSHGDKTIAPLSEIIDYVSGLNNTRRVVDSTLPPHLKAQRSAWSAHIESNLGDFVAYMLFSRYDNWSNMTHRVLADMYPIPHRYYIPSQLRDTFKPRLDAAGLWDTSSSPPISERLAATSLWDNSSVSEGPRILSKKERPETSEAFRKAFDVEKISNKVRPVLNILEGLLEQNGFLVSDGLTSTDILAAAHILLLLEPPFPNPLLKDLLDSSYPRLVGLARRLQNAAFDSQQPIPQKVQAKATFWTLASPTAPLPAKSEEEINTLQARWGWSAFALGSIVGIWAITGPFSALRTTKK